MGYEQGRWFQHLAQVFSGKHKMHAGEGAGGAGIDVEDTSARMGAAQHRGMQHFGEIDIVHVTALPSQQTWVFLSLNRCTEPARCHHSTSMCCSRSRSAASLTASTIF